MEFNDSYGMRYAPEENEKEEYEPHYVFCNDCGCRMNADAYETADDGEYYCNECTDIYNQNFEL